MYSTVYTASAVLQWAALVLFLPGRLDEPSVRASRAVCAGAAAAVAAPFPPTPLSSQYSYRNCDCILRRRKWRWKEGLGWLEEEGFPLQWKRGFFHFLDSHRRVEGGNFLLSFMQPSYLDSQVSVVQCVVQYSKK